MTKWEHRVDRGLGYLGLFLIGTISWLADHLNLGRASAPADRSGLQRPVVTRRIRESALTGSDARPGQRAA